MTPLELAEHRLQATAEALGNVLVKAGVLRDDRPYTGPELLHAAGDYCSGCVDEPKCAGDCNEGHGPCAECAARGHDGLG